jgi:3-oxoacyl-[acyl-carrier protein] reductase
MTHITRLKDRVAVVSGAAQGIGAGIALRLAQEGARVVLVDINDAVHATAAGLAGAGLLAESAIVDVADAQAIRDFAEALASRLGGIDILVNNAGISPKRDGRKYLVQEMDLQGWNQVLSVNLTSVFVFSQACMPHLARSGRGRIVNISSQAARTRPVSTSAHYAASKAGVTGFTRTLANEAGEAGVTVNCVAPGLIETEMFKAFSAAQREATMAQVPLKRLGQPADIASAVAFLASDDGAYITGTTIDVNGGLFMT